ncbi:KAP family P-loop NTPase fold protein [Methylocaldum sp. GT1BB]|jgi:predicted KAP-like P-loop ATPase|uniref:KAP family P-loop NTPase fold protein n=1 Tax=Methylocaldum sp. GT1BB TaxID=3438963 RepID=UPI003DA15D60
MTALSADRASSDPKDDLFGHAPFAKTLAESICRYPSSDGLVLALYGPWGSGKSTVLNYVRHFLEQRPEGERPIIVPFNPWWFSGQENLARAFLGQMQAVLPERFEGFKKLGEKLAEFSEGIGGLVELAGAATGVGGVVGHALKLIASKPKDIPAIKNEITKILAEENQRIVVIIDDIDRLTPEEVRQLFTVIKALADFPNVIYLLAFDREVAADAIEKQTGLPGERFLEKIIQVPFEIPPVDRTTLQVALFKRLDVVLSGTPEELFDQSYWTNVYHEGIDALIQVPRDIIRLTNTLMVTYPAVIGEVNPVDFIAIEALRVFLPKVYDTIRSNGDQFAGHSDGGHYGTDDDKARQAFHDAWLEELPADRREKTMDFLRRIFPKLEKSIYGADWLSEWRRNQRVCVPEFFPTYFRLTVPLGEISRRDMASLLKLADTPNSLEQALIDSTLETRPDGISKTRALLNRLADYVAKDIPENHISTFINVLLNVGDYLVLPDDAQGFFDVGNEVRIRWIVSGLLRRVDKPQRLPLLEEAFTKGQSLGVQCHFLRALLRSIEKEPEGGSEFLMQMSDLDELKAIWIDNIRVAGHIVLTNSLLPQMLHAWSQWGNAEDVRDWCIEKTKTDDGLLAFLPRFCSYSKSQAMGDWAIRVKPRLNPTSIEDYIDVEVTAQRLVDLEREEKVPDSAKESVSQFLKELALIKAGKNPDGADDFDE